MKVLITGKTRYGSNACTGGLTLANDSIRIFDAYGNYPPASKYDVGQVWDMTYVKVPGKPPHVENVRVTSDSYLGQQANLRTSLQARVQVWNGPLDSVLNGMLQSTSSGSCYISQHTGVPPVSTGYWIPDSDLSFQTRYYYYDYRRLKYVGFAPAIQTITAGTLVRVSLASWWDGDGKNEDRCYLQLSGWFI